MKNRISYLISAVVVCCLLLNGALGAWAIEGFWEGTSIPPELKTRFKLDDGKIERLKKATVRLNSGGTGVFVSPNGLVLTNQHTVIDYVQKIVTSQNNYIRDGFRATDPAGELKLPETAVSVTEIQRDVTKTINDRIEPGMPPHIVRNVIIGQSREIAARTKQETGLDCEVLSTFNGTKHTLYGYKTYSDVRLVWLPERSIAMFGGDRENYNFPRYWLDIGFVRLYENGKPLQNKDFLTLSKKGPKIGEELTVAGFPISSERNLPSFQLEFLEKTELPLVASRINSQLAGLKDYASLGVEQAADAQSRIFDLENTLKAIENRATQMKNSELTARAKKNELALFEKLKNDREFSGDAAAFGILEKIYAERSVYEAERRLLDDGWALDTVFFRAGREHVRWATEKAKPLAERLPGFNDELLGRLETAMRANAPQRGPNERSKLANSLAMMQSVLGTEHPTVRKILENRTPQQRADELLKTQLDSPQFRAELIERGKIGLDETNDPMVSLMRWVDQRALELRGRHQSVFVTPDGENYQKFINALYRYGLNKQYPDANFSLRFSFGKIAGYAVGGKKIGPFTHFSGLLTTAKSNNYDGFYGITENWRNLDAKSRKTAFNFALTNDVLGGNSGSPVVNVMGELVGLVFDSNMPSLLWKYQYDETQGRAVAVDSRAIRLALDRYGSNNLKKELGLLN